MKPLKYWPWFDDSEDEIYDSPAWDLPGFRPHVNVPGAGRAGKELPGRHVSAKRYGRKRTLP